MKISVQVTSSESRHCPRAEMAGLQKRGSLLLLPRCRLEGVILSCCLCCVLSRENFGQVTNPQVWVCSRDHELAHLFSFAGVSSQVSTHRCSRMVNDSLVSTLWCGFFKIRTAQPLMLRPIGGRCAAVNRERVFSASGHYTGSRDFWCCGHRVRFVGAGCFLCVAFVCKFTLWWRVCTHWSDKISLNA